MILPLLIFLATTAAPQAVPDFSGTWTIDQTRSTAVGGGSGGRDTAGGGRGGGLGLGPAPDAMTIRQSATTITIEERRGTVKASISYRVDGTASNNMPAGRNSGVAAAYVSTWRDGRLVTRITVPPRGGGAATEYEEVRYLDKDGTLVVDTTIKGMPNRRTTVYVR